MSPRTAAEVAENLEKLIRLLKGVLSTAEHLLELYKEECVTK